MLSIYQLCAKVQSDILFRLKKAASWFVRQILHIQTPMISAKKLLQALFKVKGFASCVSSFFLRYQNI